MAKFNIRSYWQPTPKNIRKIGLSIAGLGVVFGAYLQANATQIGIDFPVLNGYVKYFPYLALLLGYLGKEATNFFHANDSELPPK